MLTPPCGASGAWPKKPLLAHTHLQAGTVSRKLGGELSPRFPALRPSAPLERDYWGVLQSPAALGLARTHAGSPGSFISSLHIEFDAYPLLQSVEVETLKAAAVEEYLLALRSADKSKPTITDNSLDCPLHGHLGQRMGIFALGHQTIGQPAREVTSPTHWRNFTNTQASCQRAIGLQVQHLLSIHWLCGI